MPNTGGELRLGMYADVVVAGVSGTSAPRVPRKAVQNVGDRTEVRLGQTAGGQVDVVSGVQAGDVVVTEGSFFVRAERERLGPRPTASTANASATPASSSGGRSNEAAQTAKVVVTEQGYEPARGLTQQPKKNRKARR